MELGSFFQNKKIKLLESQVKTLTSQVAAQLFYPSFLSPILSTPYTGEKTPGEMGSAKDYKLQYEHLRVRSWQSYLESEITSTIINKYCLWVIGNGLYVQSEPELEVLKQEGINSLDKDFQKNVQTRFNLWVSSRHSDSAGMQPVNILGYEAFKNAIIGGDVLVINFIEKGSVTQQVIDGSHVVTPDTNSSMYKDAIVRGNRIESGVEIGANNAHIAYFVRGANNTFYRIERLGKQTGRVIASLVYGSKYKLDNVRGLPLIAANLETLRKLDRYKEATVGGEEERQKIAFTIEHVVDSTGENPFLAKFSQSSALGMGIAPETKSTSEYEAAATKVATMTSKSVANMPPGAMLKMHSNPMAAGFKEFYETNIQFICASVGIPYEVALSMYNSNYSASRAAIKEWEHSMKVSRQRFAEQYYQPFFNLWLEITILTGKINAPGYIKAITDNNIMAIEAYQSARWLGANLPHIDPVKEVQAERLKLGDLVTPLTTYDQASERLGSGDFSQNLKKVKSEKEDIKMTIGEQKPVQQNKETKKDEDE